MDYLNEKPFDHHCHHGTEFRATRCDFKEGLLIKTPRAISAENLVLDMSEMIGFHATNILPRLNGFQGYDAYNVKFVTQF